MLILSIFEYYSFILSLTWVFNIDNIINDFNIDNNNNKLPNIF